LKDIDSNSRVFTIWHTFSPSVIDAIKNKIRTVQQENVSDGK